MKVGTHLRPLPAMQTRDACPGSTAYPSHAFKRWPATWLPLNPAGAIHWTVSIQEHR
jgi:hypothetical protein